jgi:hypothetical protein
MCLQLPDKLQAIGKFLERIQSQLNSGWLALGVLAADHLCNGRKFEAEQCPLSWQDMHAMYRFKLQTAKCMHCLGVHAQQLEKYCSHVCFYSAIHLCCYG